MKTQTNTLFNKRDNNRMPLAISIGQWLTIFLSYFLFQLSSNQLNFGKANRPEPLTHEEISPASVAHL